MSDDHNRLFETQRIRQRTTEPVVNDDLLVDDITTVAAAEPVDEPAGDQVLADPIDADPIDAGIVRVVDDGADDGVLTDAVVDSDDVLGVRETAFGTPQIDDSYVSMEEEAADEEGEDPAPEPEVKPETQPKEETPSTETPISNERDPDFVEYEQMLDEAYDKGVIDFTKGWTGGPDEMAPDEVVAQTDEDGIPLDDDIDLGGDFL